MIQILADDPDSDAEVWRWLGQLLGHLKADGMSSDESATEGQEAVYRVKIIVWRHQEVDGYMDIIDHQRLVDAEIWTPRGAKPGKRLRGARHLKTTRHYVDGLPDCLYDEEWKDGLVQRLTLNVSQEDFQWVQIMTR
jgi:hypothetical protein